MQHETCPEHSAEDMAGALPKFPDKPIRFKNRKHSNSFSHSGNNGLTVNGIPSSEECLSAAFHKVSLGSGTSQIPTERKNSRKPRNGNSKNGNKKFGSKDIWVRVYDEMDDLVMDQRDPEYDSGAEEEPLAFSFDKQSAMSAAEFETFFVNLVNEFFEHMRPDEVLSTLREIEILAPHKTNMPYLAILAAMPHKTSKCELASELLTFLSSRFLTANQMQQSFLKLLHDLPDITLDIPRAPEHIGRFIARAIADGILPPNFLLSDNCQLNQLVSEISHALCTSHSPPISAPACSNLKKSLRTYSGDQSSGISSASASLGTSLNGSASTGLTPAFELSAEAHTALRVAESMLKDATNCVKFNGIWGRHCGLRATRELIKDIQLILAKYMQDPNTQEVDASIRLLEAPSFHHEIVYQAILSAIESGAEEGVEKIVLLLKELCDSVLISYDQLCRGVKRVYVEMPLLQTETPLAYSLLNRFITRSVQSKFFPTKLAQECPSKARKRYVSEGDSLHYRQ